MDLCHAYVQRLEKDGKYSAKEVSGLLRLYVDSSELAHVQADAATGTQFTDLLRPIVEAGHGRTAAKVRSYLHAAYASALRAKLDPAASSELGRHNLSLNPISHISSLSEFTNTKDRVLGKSELKALWSALHPVDESQLKFPHRIVRLDILLGGQRCKQLLRARGEKVDLEANTIVLHDPKGGRKQPRRHALPLVPGARHDVVWFLGHARDLSSDFLFPGSTAGQAFDANALFAAVRALSKELLAKQQVSSPFGYGDFRRTMETTLASLGVDKDVRARIQSHDLGGIQDRHYNRHAYMKEMLAALVMWENFLDAL
jgi:integrase